MLRLRCISSDHDFLVPQQSVTITCKCNLKDGNLSLMIRTKVSILSVIDKILSVTANDFIHSFVDDRMLKEKSKPPPLKRKQCKT